MTLEATAEALRVFGELNSKEKRVPWSERRRLISHYFPSVDRLDWMEVFRQDPGLMGRIINDILKLDAAVPGKPGKRPGLDQKDAERRLATLLGERYSELPFPQAFRNLAGERSVRHVATKTGLNRNTIHRLMTGTQVPDEWEIEQIAAAFDVAPSYFTEYRMAAVVGFIYSQLMRNPEATVIFYKKINDAAEAKRKMVA